MQLVRCEQCGAKALIAASQCPRCAHAFFLRDSRGETVPLGHCNVCDTYYPRSRGGCRWCGTKVSALPIGVPTILLGLVLAAGAVGVGVWQYRARTSAAEQQQGDAVPTIDARRGAQAAAGGAIAPAAAAVPEAAGDSLPGVAAGGDSAPVRIVAPEAQPGPAAPLSNSPPVPAAAAAPAAAPAAAGDVSASPPNTPYAGPWTRAVAQSWVNVRAAASIDAAIVGVVTPNARVELGDVRGGWRRVRSAGVAGWADASFFAVDSTGR